MIEAKISLPSAFLHVDKYPMGDTRLAIKDQKTGQNYGICLKFPALWILTFSRFVHLPVLNIFSKQYFLC